MKCDENGGCPFDVFTYSARGERPNNCGLELESWDDCHLTSASFSIIKAMIAGEWKCSTCSPAGWCPESELPERGYEITTHPCNAWQPRIEEGA